MKKHEIRPYLSHLVRRTWVAGLWGVLGFVLLAAGLTGIGRSPTWDEETRSALQRELSGLTRDLQLDEERRRPLPNALFSGIPAGMTAEEFEAYRRKLDEQPETAKVSWKVPTVAIQGRGFNTQLQVVFERRLFGGADQGLADRKVERSQQLESVVKSQEMLLERRVTARLRSPSFVVEPGAAQTMVVGAEGLWSWHVVPKELGTHILLITFDTPDMDNAGAIGRNLAQVLPPAPLVGVVEVVPPATSLSARMATAVSAKWLTLAGGINLLGSLALALWLGRSRS